METTHYAHNFARCQLGDQRLNRRAQSIGQAITQRFGQALSTVFESGRELKRAYEFFPILKRPFGS